MSKKATRQAYGEALAELGRVNKNVVVLEADLSKSTKTAIFQGEFPERHFNVGIAEADLMATAAGFATTGKIAFASTFAMFAAGRGFEQIRNTIAYPKLNVKVCPTHAGISVGEDGGSHQSVEDIALMRAIPGMIVLCPADAEETKQMVFAAAEYEGPVYIRSGRLDTEDIYKDLLVQLSDAAAMIKVDQPGMKGDIIYGGDMAKWKMFANSLTMRIALRMGDVAKVKAAAAGAFASNADNAQFAYTPSGKTVNPIYDDFVNGNRLQKDFAVSKTLLDYMNGNNDPRREF